MIVVVMVDRTSVVSVVSAHGATLTMRWLGVPAARHSLFGCSPAVAQNEKHRPRDQCEGGGVRRESTSASCLAKELLACSGELEAGAKRYPERLAGVRDVGDVVWCLGGVHGFSIGAKQG